MSPEFLLFDHADYYNYEMDLWIYSARGVGTIRIMKCIESDVDREDTLQLIMWWFENFYKKDRTEMEKLIDESREDYKEHGKWLSDIFPRLL